MRTSSHFPAHGADWLQTFVMRYDWFIWLHALHWLVNVNALVLRHCFKDFSHLAIKFQYSSIFCLAARCTKDKTPNKRQVSYFLGYPPRQQLLKLFWFSSRTKKRNTCRISHWIAIAWISTQRFQDKKPSVYSLVRAWGNETWSRLLQVSGAFVRNGTRSALLVKIILYTAGPSRIIVLLKPPGSTILPCWLRFGPKRLLSAILFRATKICSARFIFDEFLDHMRFSKYMNW